MKSKKLLGIILLIYFTLLVPTLSRCGISWDEQVDMNIAHAYLSSPPWSWLRDPLLDPDNTRFPMYFVALIFALLGIEQLYAARWISCLLGALTLIGVYQYCKLNFDRKKGLLACFILATNPYFLSLARLGFTDGDVYPAAALIWTLVSVSILARKRTARWAFISAVALGLTLSSKILALAALPALFLHVKSLLLSGILILFSLLIFLLIPPVHLMNPELFYLTAQKLKIAVTPTLSYMPEAAASYFLCVLFKSSILIGIWIWVSLALALVQWRRREELRLPLIVLLFYFLTLIKIEWARPLYLMPLLPLLVIFAADQFFNLIRQRRMRCIAGGAAVLMLGVDLFLCYPDFNLNGYQWVGARYLGGQSTIGYRGIVHLDADGVEQCMKWINRELTGNQRVITYAGPEIIIHAVSPHLVYRRVDGLRENKETLLDVDYAVIGLNDQIRQGWGLENPKGDIYQYPYDKKLLEENFVKVFSVKRAFGIEAASVWKKIQR